METDTTKLCPRCNSIKPISDFSFNVKQNRHVYACKVCISSNTRQWQQKLFESSDPEDMKKATFYKILQSSKSNAKVKKIPYELNLTTLTNIYNKQEGKCYYTGVPMALRTNDHLDRDPSLISLDRLDPVVGYTPENTVLCCWGVNAMKGWHSKESLYKNLKMFYESAVAAGKYNDILT